MLKKIRIALINWRIADIKEKMELAYEDITWLGREAARFKKKIQQLEGGGKKNVF